MIQTIPADTSIVLGISIDGVEAIHDSIKGVSGSWKNAIETLRQAFKLAEEYSNLRPHISYTFNSHNAGNFQKLYNYLVENLDLNMDDFSFSVEHSGLLYNNQNMVQIEYEKIKQDIAFIREHPRKTNNMDPVAIFRSKSYENYLEGILPYLKNEKKIRCAAMQLSGYIDAYGDVYPCIMWGKKLGNIKNRSYSEIWVDSTSDKIRQVIAEKHCPGCWTPCEVQPSLLINLYKLL